MPMIAKPTFGSASLNVLRTKRAKMAVTAGTAASVAVLSVMTLRILVRLNHSLPPVEAEEIHLVDAIIRGGTLVKPPRFGTSMTKCVEMRGCLIN